MSAAAVRVQGLWKEYALGGARRETLYEAASRLLRAPWKRNPAGAGRAANFWALKKVELEVEPGEVLGVIGRNGAGKSTLLKILSRITAPTRGRIEVRGRLASLLEVGTGFHPELSGRENIFLNGAILGMTRQEVQRKFDEIVAFAEIDRFIDTPVKHYSSGMYVRLAFSVAAHVEPDVLVVDEVLAVGDRLFQEKCLGRMDAIAKAEGRTVLFVSHNLDAVSRICRSGLYLRGGEVAERSDIGSVIQAYVSRGASSAQDLSAHHERWGSGAARITSFAMRDAQGREVDTLASGHDHELVIGFEARAGSVANGLASIAFADPRGVTVMLVSSEFQHQPLDFGGSGRIVCRVRDLNLAAGTYSVTLYLGQRGGETLDCLNDVSTVDVIGGDYFGTGHGGLPEQCSTLTRSSWSLE